MKATVMRNVDRTPNRAGTGVMTGMVLEFHARHGIPVFYLDGAPAVRGVPEVAKPGMIGIGLFDNNLMTVMPDGTVQNLPLQVEPVVNSLAEIA
jgi:hypothetical protein